MFNRYYFISAMRYKNGNHDGWNYATLQVPALTKPQKVVEAWRKDAESEYPDCEFHITTFNRV